MANEKRLIYANALMDAFRSYMVERYDREKCVSEENCKTCENSCLWRRIVSVAPTVDAVEVVHGRWEKASQTMPIYKCSVCGERNLFRNGDNVLSNYCPNCGAKMDGGTEDG